MKFIDEAIITVQSGNGGSGCVSFRRERSIPRGGPDGGDGGAGGDVLLAASPQKRTLYHFHYKKHHKAQNGTNGQGKQKTGKTGKNLVIEVPPGTLIIDLKTGQLLKDLTQSGQTFTILKGGRGGQGNIRFKTSTHRAPRFAQPGETGQFLTIKLELKLLADVGIIGFPNAGKSTLIRAVSSAQPKIGDYPFTTLTPNLGVVQTHTQEPFIIADIPGLIEGAHLGRGLGHDFLRHIMRTKMLIHLIDASTVSPVEDVMRVNTELSLFDSALVWKPQIVVVNKIDLPEVQPRLTEIREAFSSTGISTLFISAATGKGVSELMVETMRMLIKVASEREGIKVHRKVFRPQPKDSGVSIHKEGDDFVVVISALERMVTRDGVTGAEMRGQLKRQLARLGVNKALEKAGVKSGDRVRCGDLEWEWP